MTCPVAPPPIFILVYGIVAHAGSAKVNTLALVLDIVFFASCSGQAELSGSMADCFFPERVHVPLVYIMANIVPLPSCLQKMVADYIMTSVHHVSLCRLKVLNEIRVIRTLVLPGEYIPVSDLIQFVSMWSWRPMLKRS